MLFFRRNKVSDVGRYLRRIRDLTIPNYCNHEFQPRQEDRHNRSIPMLLCPWENGEPVEDEISFVVARDVGSHGLGLLICQPIRVGQVALGMRTDENDPSQPWFFRGEARHLTTLGGGFWTMGVELEEFLNAEYSREIELLRPLAARLLPRHDAAAATVESPTV